MTSFTPSTPLDLSQMTNDELEDLVANLGSGSAKPAASGINWDDALFECVLRPSLLGKGLDSPPRTLGGHVATLPLDTCLCSEGCLTA